MPTPNDSICPADLAASLRADRARKVALYAEYLVTDLFRTMHREYPTLWASLPVDVQRVLRYELRQKAQEVLTAVAKESLEGPPPV